MTETDIAIYIEEETGIPVVVGKRADRNGINIINVGSIPSNQYMTELLTLQVSIRNEDLDIAMEWKESVISSLRGKYGTFGQYNCVIFIDSIGAMIYEDDGLVCHIPIFINIKRI